MHNDYPKLPGAWIIVYPNMDEFEASETCCLKKPKVILSSTHTGTHMRVHPHTASHTHKEWKNKKT